MTSSERSVITTHLRQLHAAESASVGELRILRDEAHVPALAALLDQHISATQEQTRLLAMRLEELGATTSLSQLAERYGSTMLKGIGERLRHGGASASLRDAFVAEAGEIASYTLLRSEAIRAGDHSTEVLAKEIRAAECAMRDELRTFWHQAVERDLSDLRESSDDPHEEHCELVRALRDVHAIELAVIGSLAMARSVAPDETAEARIEDHHAASKRHAADVRTRLHELGDAPKSGRGVRTAVFSLMSAPMQVLRTDQTKQAYRDMYVMEHLEVAAYDHLAALAEAVGDDRTLALAERHRLEEHAMIDWLVREAGAFVRSRRLTSA